MDQQCNHSKTCDKSYSRSHVNTECIICGHVLLKRNVVKTCFKVVELDDGTIYCTECDHEATVSCF